MRRNRLSVTDAVDDRPDVFMQTRYGCRYCGKSYGKERSAILCIERCKRKQRATPRTNIKYNCSSGDGIIHSVVSEVEGLGGKVAVAICGSLISNSKPTREIASCAGCAMVGRQEAELIYNRTGRIRFDGGDVHQATIEVSWGGAWVYVAACGHGTARIWDDVSTADPVTCRACIDGLTRAAGSGLATIVDLARLAPWDCIIATRSTSAATAQRLRRQLFFIAPD